MQSNGPLHQVIVLVGWKYLLQVDTAVPSEQTMIDLFDVHIWYI